LGAVISGGIFWSLCHSCGGDQLSFSLLAIHYRRFTTSAMDPCSHNSYSSLPPTPKVLLTVIYFSWHNVQIVRSDVHWWEMFLLILFLLLFCFVWSLIPIRLG
jgi:hypothetical protein